MTRRPAGILGLGTAWFAVLCGAFVADASANPTSDAINLYKEKRYSESLAAFQRIVASNPSNAAACYYLAMSLEHTPGYSMDDARSWLDKAVKLAPGKEAYLAEYAGISMLIADRDSSFVIAVEGREAMTKAIAMDPGDVEAREGLMQFCAKAPWPLGDADKAMGIAADIGITDPKRGAADYLLIAGIFDKQDRKDKALEANQAAQKLSQQR
jgi:tetratricopeptide (TPR) repeat protein